MKSGAATPAIWILAFVLFDLLMVGLVLAFASVDVGFAIPWRSISIFAALALIGGVSRLHRR